MNVSTLIASRYLRTSGNNRFFSWISNLSILGIGIGIATMIVVLSVIDGFETKLRERFLAANAHITAYQAPDGVKEPEKWESEIQQQFAKEITGIAPFIHADTMTRKDHLVHTLLIKGIAPKKREQVQNAQGIVRPPSALNHLQAELELSSPPATPSIILGAGLLSAIAAKIGDNIDLVSPSEENKDPFEQMKSFKIVGVYDSGLQLYDNQIGILSLKAAQDLFHMPSRVTGLEIGLKNPNDSELIASKMREQYPLSIEEWQSYNRNIFAAIKQQRTLIAFIVALVAFVASFNILTTLFVAVTQKQKDISILKALGATDKHILKIFLKQSCLMGIVGGVFGVLLALIVSIILYNYPFIDLPKVYMLAHLPVEFEWRVYTIIVATGVFVSSLAGLYPAWIATKVTPTEGLSQGRRN